MTALAAPLDAAVPAALTFDEVYDPQDAFVVVHRRLADFEGRSAITTWLFGITRKVAAKHRKRAPATAEIPEMMSTADPFCDAVRAEAAAQVTAILDQMDDA